ncbi:MAG: hypothetical protein AAF389_14880 [Gemmatimonadota bacterium]
MNLRDQILAVPDLPAEHISVPEWPGVEVFQRRLSHDEAAAFVDFVNSDGVTESSLMLELVQKTVCDADGNLAFAPEDMPAVAKKSNAAIKRLFENAKRMNRVGPEAEKEIEGN